MNFLRRNALVPLLAVGGAAVLGLVVGGTAGAVLAAGLLVCGAVAAAMLVIRRLQREQARRLQRLVEAVASLERATVDARTDHSELSARLDTDRAESQASFKSLGIELIAAERRAADRHAQAKRWAEASAERDRTLTEQTVQTGGDLKAARAELDQGFRAGRDAGRAEARRLYGKVEDLLGLYHDIAPDRALPHMQGWAAGVDLARYLYRQVSEQGRENVIECGSGTSTVLFAYAMRARGAGRVVALEHEPEFAEATRRMLRERDLDAWAEVVDAPLVAVPLGDATWHWYDPSTLPDGPFDLLVVDGPPGKTGPQARYPALPLLRDRLSPGAMVVLDDALRPEELATAERWSAEFAEFTEERVGHERGTIVLRSPAGD
jgi:predicted O-methyltransferase YrrM